MTRPSSGERLWRRARTARNQAGYATAFPRGEAPLGYLGWVGKGNVGDDGMLEAHRLALAGVTVAPLPSTEIARSLAWATRRGSRVAVSGLLLGGGTVFGRRDWRTRLTELEPLLTATPRMGVGLGVEDPAFQSGRYTDAEELRRWVEMVADWPVLSVRGPRSRALLVEHGLDAPISGDPALLLDAVLVGAGQVRERTLGVSLAEAEARWDSEGGSVLDKVLPTLERLVGDGWTLRLLSFSRWDHDLITRLHRRFGAKAELEPAMSPTGLVKAVQSCHVVLGERLHAAVFAAAAGTPAVALAYRPKVLDFMDSVGASDCVMRTDQPELTGLEELLRGLAEERDTYAARTNAEVALLRTALREDLAEVRRLVTSA